MIKLPSPDMYDSFKTWGGRLISVLEGKFSREVAEETVGRIDVFAIALPDTHYPTDGTEFDVDAAPLLAIKLGETFGAPSGPTKCVLPDIATPYGSDTIIGIRKT